MSYITVINGLHTRFGAHARVCTRYNKNAVSDSLRTLPLEVRDTKMVVVDHGEERSTFTLKAMQVHITGEDYKDSASLLELVKHNFLVQSAETDPQLHVQKDIAEALKYSGLNSNLLYALRNSLEAVRDCLSFTAGDGCSSKPDEVELLASSNFAGPYVMMVFKSEYHFVVLRFTE